VLPARRILLGDVVERDLSVIAHHVVRQPEYRDDLVSPERRVVGTSDAATCRGWISSSDSECSSGSGYGPFTASASVSCPTSVIGTRNVKGTVRDHDGDEAEYAATVEVTALYSFDGFLPPVRNDVLNQVEAGQAVPVKLRLGGDQIRSRTWAPQDDHAPGLDSRSLRAVVRR